MAEDGEAEAPRPLRLVFNSNQPIDIFHYDFMIMFLESRKHSFGPIRDHSLLDERTVLITYESAEMAERVARKRFFQFKKYLLRARPVSSEFEIHSSRKLSLLSFQPMPVSHIFEMAESRLVVRNLRADDDSDIQLYAGYLVDENIDVVKIVKSKLAPSLIYLTYADKLDKELIAHRHQKRPRVCGETISLYDSFDCNSVIIFNPCDDTDADGTKSQEILSRLSGSLGQPSIDLGFVYSCAIVNRGSRILVIVEFPTTSCMNDSLPAVQKSVDTIIKETGCSLFIEELHNYHVFDWLIDNETMNEADGDLTSSNQAVTETISASIDSPNASHESPVESVVQTAVVSSSQNDVSQEKSADVESTLPQKTLGQLVLPEEQLMHQIYLYCDEVQHALRDFLLSKDKSLIVCMLHDPQTMRRKSLVIEGEYEEEGDGGEFKWKRNVFSWLKEFNKSHLDYKTIILPKNSNNRVVSGTTVRTVSLSAVIGRLKALTEKAKQEDKMINFLEFEDVNSSSYCIKCHGLKRTLEQNVVILKQEIERLKLLEAEKPSNQEVAKQQIKSPTNCQETVNQSSSSQPVKVQTTINLDPNRLLGMVLKKCPKTLSFVEKYMKDKYSDELTLTLDQSSSDNVSIQASVCSSKSTSTKPGVLKSSVFELVKQFESNMLINQTIQSGMNIADKLGAKINSINFAVASCYFEIGPDKNTVLCYGIKHTTTEQAIKRVSDWIQRLDEEFKSSDMKFKILSSAGVAVQACIRSNSREAAALATGVVKNQKSESLVVETKEEVQKMLIDVKSGLHFSINEWDWLRVEIGQIVSQFGGAAITYSQIESGQKAFAVDYTAKNEESVKKTIDDYMSKYDKREVDLNKMCQAEESYIEKAFKCSIEKSFSPKSFNLRYWTSRDAQTGNLILNVFGSKSRIDSLTKLIEQTCALKGKRKSSESENNPTNSNDNQSENGGANASKTPRLV